MNSLAADRPSQLSRPETVSAAPSRPIVVWAMIGAATAAFVIYLGIAWITGSQFTRSGPGPTREPTWMAVSVIAQQAFFGTAAVVCVAWFLIRPRLKTGRFTRSGLWMIAVGLTFWQDSLCNYFHAVFSYNSELVNFGSFYAQVPGWQGRHPELFPYPIILLGLGWTAVFGGGGLAVVRAMGAVRRRWPGTTAFRLIIGTWLTLVVTFTILESLWIRSGLWTYAAVLPHLTLFAGTVHQLPLIYPVCDGAVVTGWVSLLFFTDRRGETIAERGLQHLKLSGATRSLVRWLAIYGAVNVMTFAAFNVPIQLFSTHAHRCTTAILRESYFNNGTMPAPVAGSRAVYQSC